LFNATTALAPSAQFLVLTAAVADYRPARYSPEKIKKNTENLSLELVFNPDTLLQLGKQRLPGQLIAGFALETNNETEHALAKLRNKRADCIVLNSLQNPQAGFAHDTNQVTVLDRAGGQTPFPLKLKTELAHDLWQHFLHLADTLPAFPADGLW
jgi:phosphopantothenoylcysteine decarboxylase/phosphopantothenate--cysteine ligase